MYYLSLSYVELIRIVFLDRSKNHAILCYSIRSQPLLEFSSNPENSLGPLFGLSVSENRIEYFHMKVDPHILHPLSIESILMFIRNSFSRP